MPLHPFGVAPDEMEVVLSDSELVRWSAGVLDADRVHSEAVGLLLKAGYLTCGVEPESSIGSELAKAGGAYVSSGNTDADARTLPLNIRGFTKNWSIDGKELRRKPDFKRSDVSKAVEKK